MNFSARKVGLIIAIVLGVSVLIATWIDRTLQNKAVRPESASHDSIERTSPTTTSR